MVGDGELRPQLETLIRQYTLESSVSMLGTVDHRRWLEILSAADIFLLPSQYEGISVALLEAMGMKVMPVVAAVGDQSKVVTSDIDNTKIGASILRNRLIHAFGRRLLKKLEARH